MASVFWVPVSMCQCFKGEHGFSLNVQANTVEHMSLKKRILPACLCVKMCISNLHLILDLYLDIAIFRFCPTVLRLFTSLEER